MDETKPWYTSKAILASIVAVLALAAGLAGNYVIGDALQTEIVDTVSQGVGLVFAALALWGRIVATKKVTA